MINYIFVEIWSFDFAHIFTLSWIEFALYIFFILQTYLVERKKASFRESQKLNSNHSSASIERNPLLSTCLVDSSADFQQKRDLLNGETDTNVDDFGTAPYSYPIDVTMRPNCNSNSSKSSRISSVPENTKRFEARSDSSDSSNNAVENETSTKSSNKKSYIEVRFDNVELPKAIAKLRKTNEILT